jgi:flagellar secretion chaperone FliS
MFAYQARALEGCSGVELTVALYEGIIRFMYNAIEAAEHGDAGQRRYAVKRAMDIVIHLQATLNMDIGGKPAEALAEFYTAIFALMLQGSQANSREKFEHVITCVKNVRDAWIQALRDPEANLARPQEPSMADSQGGAGFPNAPYAVESAVGSHWNA